MHVLLITQWFDPEPADVKGLPFARELVRRGHRVTVITGFPNYPGGLVYPGYKIRPWQIEWRHGVRVIRVPLYPSHGRGKLGRILNYGTFAWAAGTIGLAIAGRADVVYVYHPPATVALPAMMAQLIWRTPWVIDIQDMWPDAISASGMVKNYNFLKCIAWFADVVNRAATRVVVLSPGYRKELIARGLEAAKIDVIYNWSRQDGAGMEANSLIEAEAAQMAGKFVMLFAGNMGPAQALENLIEAARRLRDLPVVLFAFVGDGIDAHRLSAQAKLLPNVLFLPRRHPSAMQALFDRADALVVHLRDEPHFARTIPSKTQDYLLAGRPVLMAVRGDAAALIGAAQAGIVCTPEKPDELAAAVRQMVALRTDQRKDMGARGRDFYRDHLSVTVGVTKFEGIFQQLREDEPARGAI